MNNLEKEQLELFLDKYGMVALLTNLAEICSAKSEHVLANWQDKRLANTWQHRAHALEAMCDHNHSVRADI